MKSMDTEQNKPTHTDRNSSASIPVAPVAFQPLPVKESKHNWGKIAAIVLGIFVLLAFAVFIIATSSVNDAYEARERARDAAVRQSLHSVFASIILCSENPDNVVLEPRDGKQLCLGTDFGGVWPNISVYGGSWGGCEFFVYPDSKDISFQYCAILPDGSLFKCVHDDSDNTSGGCVVEAR